VISFPTEPMRAVLGSLPGDDDRWAYEIKWDGYRTLAFVEDGALRLQSSNRIDVTAKYPELAGLGDAVNAPRAVLDGELVVLDEHGRPRFELMQRHESQVAFYVFDVLHVASHDTVELPYEQRRTLLDSLLETGSNWMVPTHRIGGGAELLAFTADRGLEGVMAKRLGSTYVPGKRSNNWRKVKNRIQADVVIGGFTEGTGSRASTFGALLVGVRDPDGGLRFAGGVGTGFDQARLERLRGHLGALVTSECPFSPAPPREYAKGATWVRPELTATIEMSEWTNEGFVRHASFVDGG
jgi:bifunctional non-homologous end joining protein LigD